MPVDDIVRLQPLLTALVRATTTAEVITGIIDEGIAALGAQAGALALVLPHRAALEVVRAVGYAPEIIEQLRYLDLAAPVALAEVARSGAPIWLATPEAIGAAFPNAVPLAAGNASRAHALLPMKVDDRVLGVLALGFATRRLFGEATRRALMVAAELCGYTLGRARQAEVERQGKAQLGEDTEHFRLLVQSVQDYAIFLLSPTGQVLSWNPGAQRLKGYRAEEILGESLTRFYLPEDVAQGVPQALLERAATEGRVIAEGWRVRGDRSRFWAEVVLTALRDELGQLRGFAKVTRDLTERKRAEEARARASQEEGARAATEAAQAELRASRDQIAAILAGVAEGITVQDRLGHLVYANDAAAHLCGFSSATALLAASIPEILSRFELLDEDGAPFPTDGLPGRRLFRGESASETLIQFRVIATGDVRWSLVNATSICDDQGQMKFAVNIFHDVTERRQAEEMVRFLAAASVELTRSLHYEQTLAAVAHLAVPILADWCVVDVLDDVEQSRRLALTHADPARARFAQDLARRYPADPHAAGGVWEVIRTGRSTLIAEISDAQLVANARDAEHLTLLRSLQMRSVIIVPLLARGRTLGAITLVRADAGRRYGPRDLAVAEELAVRAALAVDNARLYQDAQEQAETHVKLNEALRDALSRLQESLRQRDEFLAMASHDLKNPLTTVKGMTQFLQRQHARGTLDGERTASALATIETAAKKLTAQIDGLLDIGRLRLGQPLDLARRPTDMVELVKRMVSEYQETTASHRLVVETTVPSLTGNWDPGRLERALGNLLSNAINYSPTGGKITVGLTHEGDRLDGQAVLYVRDEGVGIPAADLPQVFEPFHRGANVAARIPGTGLGLASTHQVVVQHGGSVQVASVEGEGSTFTVRLPLGNAEPHRYQT